MSGFNQYAQVFTVVIDKKQHLTDYPLLTFDPYAYSLSVLLRRVRGYLALNNAKADIIAESRGRTEDQQIMNAYRNLREFGDYFGTPAQYSEVYPEDNLVVRRKETNITGLQLADLIAFGQKVQTILENNKPFSRPLSTFSEQLNSVVDRMVNQYGRYLLE